MKTIDRQLSSTDSHSCDKQSATREIHDSITSATSFSRDNLGIFEELSSQKEKVVHHPLFVMMGEGNLPLETFRKTLLNFYPLVENFPKFMALNLAKTRCHKPGHEAAKLWLIANIKVEQNHAKWYRQWCKGFGLHEDDVVNVAPPPAMEAVVHYLWNTCTNGSVPMCFGAANVGIEWATGEWSFNVVKGVQSYIDRGIVSGADKTIMTWLQAHAEYDDVHPYEAMELVVKCADSELDITEAIAATRRSIEYYIHALDECLR